MAGWDAEEFHRLLQEGEDDEPLAESPRPHEELVVTKRKRVKQAGADQEEGKYVQEFKLLAERRLYTFTKYVLKKWWLYKPLHGPICTFLTDVKEDRHKGLLIPREHAKTSIVSHSLPLHLLIQPKEGNIYFPNVCGSHTRILLAGETMSRAQSHLGMLTSELENNVLLRALWPERVWFGRVPKSVRWNQEEISIPRSGNVSFPDPSIRPCGVDGAVTGTHAPVLIKDDLIARKAANSPAEMLNAINWHMTSRALVGGQPLHLEWIIGTRWAVQDLYDYIIKNDPSVRWKIMRALNKAGEPIYPPQGSNTTGEVIGFTKERLDYLRRVEVGEAMFALMYMNEARDASLADFLPGDLREWVWKDDALEFAIEGADERLASMYDKAPILSTAKRLEDMSPSDRALAMNHLQAT